MGTQNQLEKILTDAIECSEHTIGRLTGRITSTDSFFLWVYIGSTAAIKRVSQILLGTP